MWTLEYETHHIPNNCTHQDKAVRKYTERISKPTKQECIDILMQYNLEQSCWRYIPMRWIEQ